MGGVGCDACGAGCSGQDLGESAWPALAALLSRNTQLEVSPPPLPRAPDYPVGLCTRRTQKLRTSRRWMRPAEPLWRQKAAVRQVSSGGAVKLVGAKGTSKMELNSGRSLGPEGAMRLADMMREAQPMMLARLDLRQYLTALT